MASDPSPLLPGLSLGTTFVCISDFLWGGPLIGELPTSEFLVFNDTSNKQACATEKPEDTNMQKQMNKGVGRGSVSVEHSCALEETYLWLDTGVAADMPVTMASQPC